LFYYIILFPLCPKHKSNQQKIKNAKKIDKKIFSTHSLNQTVFGNRSRFNGSSDLHRFWLVFLDFYRFSGPWFPIPVRTGTSSSSRFNWLKRPVRSGFYNIALWWLKAKQVAFVFGTQLWWSNPLMCLGIS